MILSTGRFGHLEQELIASGVGWVLPKPYRMEEFERVVKAALSGQRTFNVSAGPAPVESAEATPIFAAKKKQEPPQDKLF